MKIEKDEKSNNEIFARASFGLSSMDTEVVPSTTRRRLSASYKLRIINRIDAAKDRGEIGRILRSEGVYSSQVSKWRKARDLGALKSLGKKNDSERSKIQLSSSRLKALEKENAKLEKKLRTANTIIDFQKKVLSLFSDMSQETGEG